MVWRREIFTMAEQHLMCQKYIIGEKTYLTHITIAAVIIFLICKMKIWRGSPVFSNLKDIFLGLLTRSNFSNSQRGQFKIFSGTLT